MTRLALIRHGETVWNAERRFTTHSDAELSDAGVAQATAAAEALAAETIDRIYTSPLQRAARTAAIIAEAQHGGCPVMADDRLVEIDAGPFEGKTSEELEAGPLAAAFAAWHTDDAEPVFPDGAETFVDALARASAFLAEHEGETGTTLIVTHGSLARLIVCSHFLGGPPPLHRRLWLDNCRLTVFEERQGVSKMVVFNATRIG